MEYPLYSQMNLINEMKINRLSKRKVYLNTEVNDESIFVLREQILKIVENDINKKVSKKDLKPIELFISSDGGSCIAGLSIVSLCNRLKQEGYIIKTIVPANAYSMGSIIACASASNGCRYIEEHGQHLIHMPRVYKFNDLSTTEDLRRQSEEMRILWERMIKIYKENSKLDDDFFKRITDRNEDCWIWAEDVVKYGLADKII